MIAIPLAVSTHAPTTTATTTLTPLIPISMMMGSSSNDNNSTNAWYTPVLGTNNTATTTTTTTAGADNISAIIGTNVSTHIAPAISHVLLAPKTTTTSTLATMAANALPTITTTAPTMSTTMTMAIAMTTTTTTLPTTTTQTTMLTQDLVSSVAMVYNTTGATADDVEKINSFYFFKEPQLILVWILFWVIVLLNSAVLFVMIINKNRKSRMNYFIKQLAFADLCVGLICVSVDLLEHTVIEWRAGNIACKMVKYSQLCVMYSSTYVLVAMSIDRYDAITHPMNFSKSWKRARYLVAWAWILGALFALPAIVFYHEEEIDGLKQCWINFDTAEKWQIYMTLAATTIFIIPTIIIAACYAIIVKTIWSKGSIFVPTERAGYTNTATRRASSRGMIPRAKIKTVKMTLVIVCAFIVCWLPYMAWDVLQVFDCIPKSDIYTAITTLMQSFAPLNSAANPIIYCVFSSQVFRTLSRFAPFKWFTCCCKSYRNNSQQNRCTTVGRRLHNSASDSMRTLTTSLTVSRRSNKTTSRVVICERPKVSLPMSDV